MTQLSRIPEKTISYLEALVWIITRDESVMEEELMCALDQPLFGAEPYSIDAIHERIRHRMLRESAWKPLDILEPTFDLLLALRNGSIRASGRPTRLGLRCPIPPEQWVDLRVGAPPAGAHRGGVHAVMLDAPDPHYYDVRFDRSSVLSAFPCSEADLPTNVQFERISKEEAKQVFLNWWDAEIAARGRPPTSIEGERWAIGKKVGREWARHVMRELPEEKRLARGAPPRR